MTGRIGKQTTLYMALTCPTTDKQVPDRTAAPSLPGAVTKPAKSGPWRTAKDTARHPARPSTREKLASRGARAGPGLRAGLMGRTGRHSYHITQRHGGPTLPRPADVERLPNIEQPSPSRGRPPQIVVRPAPGDTW